MAIILQIETATAFCSVAISVDGKTIALKEEAGQNLHASNLTLFIDEVLKSASIEYKKLEAIAVSKGPGSYTGLRIGVSTAKGLCYALDIPMIAIETLDMMAAGFLNDNPEYTGLICPMIDARRMEVYTKVLDKDLNIIEDTNAKIIDESSFNNILSLNQVTFLGDGAEKCVEAIKHHISIFSQKNYNSASNMSMLAHHIYQKRNFENMAYFEPFYLKDFVFTTPKKKV